VKVETKARTVGESAVLYVNRLPRFGFMQFHVLSYSLTDTVSPHLMPKLKHSTLTVSTSHASLSLTETMFSAPLREQKGGAAVIAPNVQCLMTKASLSQSRNGTESGKWNLGRLLSRLKSQQLAAAAPLMN
jgi:hypothetical protein